MSHTIRTTLLSFVTLALTTSAFPSASQYCTSTPNSAGPGAHIAWAGPFNPQFGALAVTGAPASAAGYFVYAKQPAQVPFGDGFLCVASPAWYLARKPTSAQGDVALRIWQEAENEDLQWLTYPDNIGITWYFQYAYRDGNGPGGTGTNSTDGVAVVFGL